MRKQEDDEDEAGGDDVYMTLAYGLDPWTEMGERPEKGPAPIQPYANTIGSLLYYVLLTRYTLIVSSSPTDTRLSLVSLSVARRGHM